MMKMNKDPKKIPEKTEKRDAEAKGVYLYCIAEGNANEDFGSIGINGNRVYTVSFKDVNAVVHSCKAEAYNSKDNETVKRWVVSHQNVVDRAMEKHGTVIPLGFDTIIRGDEKKLLEWLEKDYDNIKNKLEKVKGKKEYGVQIFIDEKIIANKLVEKNEDIRKMKEKIEKMQKGAAFMFQKKMEGLIKNIIENEEKKMFDDFYKKIKNSSDEVKIEKNKDSEKGKMILNLSVLLKDENLKMFSVQLDDINKREGVSVRFVGPFAPYSFCLRLR